MIHRASLHAGFELFADAARSNADSIHRQSQLCSDIPPRFYLGLLFANVVFQDQGAVPRIKFFEAAVKAIEESFISIWISRY